MKKADGRKSRDTILLNVATNNVKILSLGLNSIAI
jgi:hypothetical protein